MFVSRAGCRPAADERAHSRTLVNTYRDEFLLSRIGENDTPLYTYTPTDTRNPANAKQTPFPGKLITHRRGHVKEGTGRLKRGEPIYPFSEKRLTRAAAASFPRPFLYIAQPIAQPIQYTADMQTL